MLLLVVATLAFAANGNAAPADRMSDDKVAQLLFKIFGNNGCTEAQELAIRSCTASVIQDLEPFANVSFLPDTAEIARSDSSSKTLTKYVQTDLLTFGSNAKNGSVFGMLADDADPTLVDQSCRAYTVFRECTAVAIGDSSCAPLYHRLMTAAYSVICTPEFKQVLSDDSVCLSTASAQPAVETCFAAFNDSLASDFETAVATKGLPATICASIDNGLNCLRPVAKECGSGVVQVAASLASNMIAAIFGQEERCELAAAAPEEIETTQVPTESTTTQTAEASTSTEEAVSAEEMESGSGQNAEQEETENPELVEETTMQAMAEIEEVDNIAGPTESVDEIETEEPSVPEAEISPTEKRPSSGGFLSIEVEESGEASSEVTESEEPENLPESTSSASVTEESPPVAEPEATQAAETTVGTDEISAEEPVIKDGDDVTTASSDMPTTASQASSESVEVTTLAEDIEETEAPMEEVGSKTEVPPTDAAETQDESTELPVKTTIAVVEEHEMEGTSALPAVEGGTDEAEAEEPATKAPEKESTIEEVEVIEDKEQTTMSTEMPEKQDTTTPAEIDGTTASPTEEPVQEEVVEIVSETTETPKEEDPQSAQTEEEQETIVEEKEVSHEDQTTIAPADITTTEETPAELSTEDEETSPPEGSTTEAQPPTTEEPQEEQLEHVSEERSKEVLAEEPIKEDESTDAAVTDSQDVTTAAPEDEGEVELVDEVQSEETAEGTTESPNEEKEEENEELNKVDNVETTEIEEVTLPAEEKQEEAKIVEELSEETNQGNEEGNAVDKDIEEPAEEKVEETVEEPIEEDHQEEEGNLKTVEEHVEEEENIKEEKKGEQIEDEEQIKQEEQLEEIEEPEEENQINEETGEQVVEKEEAEATVGPDLSEELAAIITDELTDTAGHFPSVIPQFDCFDELSSRTFEELEDPDVWVPRCHDDGQYKDVQCKQIGYCWCVANANGHEVPDTRIKADMDKSEVIECNSKRYKIEYKTVETIEDSGEDDEIDDESTLPDDNRAAELSDENLTDDYHPRNVEKLSQKKQQPDVRA